MKENQWNRTWQVTLLTPLHVGDGESLILNRDYINGKKDLSVICLDTLLEQVADIPGAVSDLTRMNLSEFIRSYNLSIQPDYLLERNGGTPSEIRRFLKNAHGQPYLAGTTIKGAIRTALWMTLNRKHLPPVRNFRSFDKEVKKLSGEPHNDFLRPLAVSDSTGISPDNTLYAAEIKFFNIQRDNRPGWKDFASRRTLDRFEDAAGISVEALKPGTHLYVRAELNRFLQLDEIVPLSRIPQARGLDNFQELAQTINTHSRNIALSERDFFSSYRPATAAVADFYDQLAHGGFKEMENRPGSFIVRMAWGSGWKGMTGNWINDKDLEMVRRERKLGKKGVPVFPKTRRLVMKNGYPAIPMGWAIVDPVSDTLFAHKSPSEYTETAIVDIRDTDRDKKADSTAQQTQRREPVSTEAAHQDILKQFRTNLTDCKNLPGEIGTFVQKIESQTDETLKKEMCRALMEKGKTLGKKKKFSRALAEGKKWALEIENLCKPYLNDL